MITIISGTNRKFSKTLVVANAYRDLLNSLGIDSQVFSMEELPEDISKTYLSDPKDPEFVSLIEKYINSVEKIIVVIPEYQATFPGIFKLMLDGVPHKAFAGKRVAMVGVSSGRGGNVRGMDHLTSAFHYLEAYVYPNKLPISGIRELMSADFKLTDINTLAAMKRQAEGFLKY
jgi:NAD(P)H-dependent FMN reductase